MVAAELPEELILNILVRLPVKSLGRFRCICKPWRSLINDPSFIRQHVDRVSIGNEFETAIFFIQSGSFFSSKITSIKSMEIIGEEERGGGGSDRQGGGISNPTVKLLIKDIDLPDLPEEFRSYDLFIKSSCDGILCMASSDFLLLWNPSIKEYKTFPLPGESVCNFFDAYGIGYDRYLDDYKVFRLPSPSSITAHSRSSVEVLALKSNSWKTIQDNFTYYAIEDWEHATFTNGAIHWVAYRAKSIQKVIVYLDVTEEKFGEVPLPCGGNQLTGLISLQLLGGNLCLLQQSRDGDLAIWVMKEYGVGESWTKLTSLPLRRPGKGYKAVKVCSAGILFASVLTGDIVTYDPRYNKFSNIGSIGGFTRNIAYMKSLVSPMGSAAIVRN